MKQILVLALCWLSFSSVFAQSDSITTLAFGFGGGFYSSEINLTNTSRAEYEVLPVDGIQIGASIRYFNNRAVGFVGELNFTQGGWRERSAPNTPAYRNQQSYFEIQLLTQLAIGRKLIRPMLQAGPYFSFPVAQSDEVPSDFTLPDGENYYGSSLPFRPNYGLAIGGGLIIQVGQIGVQLEGRFLAGLSDLIRSGDFGVSTTRRQALGGRITFYYEL